MSIFAQVAGNIGLSALRRGDVVALSLGAHAGVLQDPSRRFVNELLGATYGDTELFASVTVLCEARLLAPGPRFCVREPSYVSLVTREMADEVAASLNFCLQDYV